LGFWAAPGGSGTPKAAQPRTPKRPILHQITQPSSAKPPLVIPGRSGLLHRCARGRQLRPTRGAYQSLSLLGELLALEQLELVLVLVLLQLLLVLLLLLLSLARGGVPGTGRSLAVAPPRLRPRPRPLRPLAAPPRLLPLAPPAGGGTSGGVTAMADGAAVLPLPLAPVAAMRSKTSSFKTTSGTEGKALALITP